MFTSTVTCICFQASSSFLATKRIASLYICGDGSHLRYQKRGQLQFWQKLLSVENTRWYATVDYPTKLKKTKQRVFRNDLDGDFSSVESSKGDELTPIQKALRSGDDFIYGVSPVYAALVAKRRSPIHELYIQENANFSKHKAVNLVEKIKYMAEEANIPIQTVTKGDLNNLCGQRPHQGVILRAAPLVMESIEQLISSDICSQEKAPIWLALDEVTDPQNLGSLLRTACFLGMTGVVVSEKNSAPLSGTVSKASAGAMELMTIHAVRNMTRFLKNSQRHGWYVLGASMETNSVDMDSIHSSIPIILVLGSEGFGLRTNVHNICDGFVSIPSNPSDSLSIYKEFAVSFIDSLNVSVAGGIIMATLLANRNKKS
eukprot:jgi/Galph1/4523/GphlegSOOS_G3172.1